MLITVKGKQMDVGDALRDHVVSNMDALVGKYFDAGIDANVVFSKEAHLFKADISVHPMRGMTAQGNGSGADAYAAFEAAAERIDKQLRRYKRRLKDKKGASTEEVLAAQYAVIATPAEDVELPEEEGAPAVVAEMAHDIPVCTVSGAVMRLDLSNATAMMFRNSAHGGLNMIYRRADGNIGWVDPRLAGEEA